MLHVLVLALVLALDPHAEHLRFAEAVATVLEEEPALFRDDPTKAKTAALVVAIAFRESTFQLDAVGDKGRSVCAMQVYGGRSELLADPEACVRAGVQILRESMRACREHPVAIYAAGPGGCSSIKAQRISRDRMWLARTTLAKVAP